MRSSGCLDRLEWVTWGRIMGLLKLEKDSKTKPNLRPNTPIPIKLSQSATSARFFFFEHLKGL